MNDDVDFSEPAYQPSTLVDLLRRRAHHQPDRRAYTFLTDGETTEVHLTYADLDRQARAIGARLQGLSAAGERALLLYPPGLEYIAGFFGCLYAGVIAVPAYPPDPARLERTLPRLQTMVADAQTTLVLTTSPILTLAEVFFAQAPDLKALRWLATDDLPAVAPDGWQSPALGGDSLAFLQYTSGSTRTPRGVMLSHGNLLHNSALIHRSFELSPASLGVAWLPPYHDMGLIGGILQPVYGGFRCILMSPLAFLQRPLRWLQAMSRYQATASGGPNFAFDLCVRKITPEQRDALDLSRWRLAFNGAEPVRVETLDRFAAAFGPCGFRRDAFYPCYGLAEATLLVSGGPTGAEPVIHTVQKAGFARGQVLEAGDDEAGQTLVGCGQTLAGEDIAIVRPDSLTRCPPDQIGEIWIAGPSVARGYWRRPAETAETFQARLAGTGEGPFLRTGDLGFLREGQLFVTGRRKDLIIIRGRNHYPQDIEWTVEQSHPALRPGCGAAFSVEAPGSAPERLVVVSEIYTHRQWDLAEVVQTIRRAVADAHEAQVYAVVLVKPRSIPKTSSGKIQRHACRAGFLDGTLDVVEASLLDAAGPGETEDSPPVEPLLVTALRALEPEQRQLLLESHLGQRLALVLGLAPSQLDPGQPLTTLGLDSVMIVDLVTEIETGLGVTLPLESLAPDITLAQLAARVLAELAAPPPPPAPAPAPDRPPAATDGSFHEYPLSYGQRALWFLQQMAPTSAAYNVVHGARVRAEVDIPALRRAFQKLVERHPVLRTTFPTFDGEPVQRVHPQLEAAFGVEDASDWSLATLNERLAEEVYRPFDLAQGPLVRVTLFRRSEREQLILLGMHHVVTDLWSLAVSLHEVGLLYTAEITGEAAPLKPLAATYADYVRWQTEMLAGPEGERLWAYWRETLADARSLPVLNLPTDHPRPPVQTYRGAARTLRLDAALSQALKAMARACGVTLHATLLAAFQALLHRYTGQDEILIGSPRASRQRKLARLVGYFVNPVVLRANLAGNPPFAAFLAESHRAARAAFEHGDFPFPLLIERLHPVRDPSRSPLFQVVFAWQKTTSLLAGQQMTSLALGEAGRPVELGTLQLESVDLEQRVAPFDLTLLMAEAGEELVATLEYNTALFEADTIARMLGNFETLLAGIAADPERRVSALPLLAEAERRQLLVDWNDTQADFPGERCAHQLFEAQVERTPEAAALAFEGETLTYRELNRRANQLAHHLQKLGVGPDTMVGLAVERSPEMIAGILGVLKAGGAYLPLDPSYPPDRLAFMLDDARVTVLLTQANLLEQLPLHAPRSTPDALRAIRLDADWPAIARERDDNPASPVTPRNLAYVIYTSGSTGRPKGVLLEHRGLCNFATGCIRQYGLGPGKRVLQFFSLSFDGSVADIFLPLLSGATLCLASREALMPGPDLTRTLREQGITNSVLTPSVLAALGSPGDGLDAFQTLLCGGESCSPEIVARWAPGRRFFNFYGPTETTVAVATYPVDDLAQTATNVPIGRPMANARLHILDPYLQPVPAGVPGELYIGGEGVARGYLNRPALTADKFRPDPFSAEPGARLYKTGDLTRYRPDGNLEFLGRIDHQVKIRGFRVELGEIEAVLKDHPQVKEAVALARDASRGLALGDRLLAAYVVPAGGEAPAVAELRGFLQERLPEYMVPSAFVTLEALPLTPNGKLDRRMLPAPAAHRAEAGSAPPRNEVEQSIAAIWEEVLGVGTVGIHDNFFDLGGHSLKMARVHSRLQEVLGRELSMVELFKYPTIGLLAEYLSHEAEGAPAFRRDPERVSKQKDALRRRKARMQAAARREEKGIKHG